MHAASIFIMMLTFRNANLVPQVKVYVWILAAIDILTSVIAVPLYVPVPTGRRIVDSLFATPRMKICLYALILLLLLWKFPTPDFADWAINDFSTF